MPKTQPPREFTLTVSGNIVDTLSAYWQAVPPPPGEANHSRRGHVEVEGLFCSFFTSKSVDDDATDWSATLTAALGTGLSNATGGVVNASGTGSTTILDPDGPGGSPGIPIHEFEEDFSGSYTISADVEEWFEIVACDGVDSAGWPTYGGAAHIDAPQGNRRRCYLRLREGGTLSLTVTSGPLTYTDSIVISSDPDDWKEVPWNVTLIATVDAVSGSEPLTVSLTCEAAGIGLDAPGFSDSAGASSYSAEGGASITIDGTAQNGFCQLVASPPIAYSAEAKVYALKTGIGTPGSLDAYPGSVSVYVDKYGGMRGGVSGLGVPLSGSGGVSWSDTLRRYGASAQIGPAGSPQASEEVSVDEWTPLRCYLSTSWLSTAGEEADDWRVTLRGAHFDAGTVSQSASVTVQPGFTESSGGDSNITKTFGTPKSFAGYRYLRIGGSPALTKVTIGSKEWTQDRTGAALNGLTDAVIDLCSPTNASGSMDATDTKWPVDGPRHKADASGFGWGVDKVSEIVFTMEDAETEYTFGDADLIREDYSTLTFLPAYKQWAQEQQLSDEVHVNRLVQGDTDGRQSYEFAGFYQQEVGPVTIYFSTSLQDLIDDFGWFAENGWSASAGSGLGDGYHELTGMSGWAFGGGVYYTDNAYRFGVDRSASSSLSIVAQALHDQVELYPGCGDVFGYGSVVGDSTPLRWAKILRGQACGLVLEPDALPCDGCTVVVTDTVASVSAGSGTTDSDGRYLTGSPYARGGRSHQIESQEGSTPYPSITTTMRARKRHRACFRPAGSSEWLTYDVSDAGRQAVAYIQDGSIWMGTSRNIAGTSWENYDTSLSGEQPCIRYERGSAAQALCMVYGSGGAVVARRSDTEGRTWGSMETIFAAGESPTLYYSRQGTLHYFCRTSDGKILGKVYDAFGNLLIDEFEAISSGVDEGAIDAWGFVTADGTHRVHLLYRSGGTVTLQASTNGRDFS